jgi:hypothetical protein
MAVLLGTAAISFGIIGFGNGRIGRRFSYVTGRPTLFPRYYGGWSW